MKEVKKIKNTRKLTIPLMLLTATFIFISLIGCASAATVNVGSGAGNQSATINGGIGIAVVGDNVVVHPGTYNENVALNKASINLSSSGTGSVIITALNTANPVITVSGTNTIINGFTITGSNSYGININSNMICTITNNTIYNNRNSGINIASGTSTQVTVDNNIIYNNGGATGSGNPNILINGGTNTISNNKIYNTLGTGDDGIRIPGGTNTIINNEIYGCEDGIDVEGGNNTIIANILRNNREDGVNVDSLGTGLTINFNAIYGNTQYGIHKTTSSGTGTLNAENNWWGHDTAPTSGSAYGSDVYSQRGTIDANPWLILTVTANPNTINVGNTSNITADFRYNSDNLIPTSPTGYRFPITQILFSTTDSPALGTLNPTSAYTNSLTDPKATSTFNAISGGLAHITVSVGSFSKQVTVKIISTTLVVTNKIYSQIKSTTPLYGSEDYYYIIVKNNGTETAKNVVITDVMSPLLSFNIREWWVSWDDQVNYIWEDSSFDPATGIWTIGNIPSGKTMYLDIRMLIRANGTITNTATATADNANNATGAFSINVPTSPTPNIDLQITNSFTTTTPNRTLTITIQGSNSTATGVIVNDGMPTEINIISWRTRTGNGAWTSNDPLYDYWTGVWNVGTLVNGIANNKTLEITFTVPTTPGTTKVTSTVYGNQNDTNLGNNYATSTFTVAAALLSSQSSSTQITPTAAFAATTTEEQSGNNLQNNTNTDTSNNVANTTDTNNQDNGLAKLISDLLQKIIESLKNTTNTILSVLSGILH